jgi:hypothetical protein
MKKVAAGLAVLWLLALISGTTLGGAIHLLLVAAIGAVVAAVLQSSKARSERDAGVLRARRDEQRDLMRRALDSRPPGRAGDDD